MPAKTLAIDPDTAPPMCPPLGLGVATDSVMVDGWAVQTMVRAAPAHEEDSGWSFTSGLETPDLSFGRSGRIWAPVGRERSVDGGRALRKARNP